jgi:hypothetical protein
MPNLSFKFSVNHIGFFVLGDIDLDDYVLESSFCFDLVFKIMSEEIFGHIQSNSSASKPNRLHVVIFQVSLLI